MVSQFDFWLDWGMMWCRRATRHGALSPATLHLSRSHGTLPGGGERLNYRSMLKASAHTGDIVAPWPEG